MPKQETGDTPTLPIPRALKTSRDVRRELVALYKQAKRRQVDPQLSSKLVYILNSIIALDQGVGIDDRLRQLEERLAGVRPNGAVGRPEARL